MLVFAHPKVGKSTALAGLSNNLIIDLEDGSQFIDGLFINVLAIAAERLGLLKPKQVLNDPNGPGTVLSVLYEIHCELAKGETVYDYITIDTATALVKIATHMATIEYKNSIIGKNFTGTTVLDLPKGAGYALMWEAFERILNWFEPYAMKASIIIAHTKDSSIIKDGVDLVARDINVTGKLKDILCSDADAIGHFRRVDGTKTILSFKTDLRDTVTGARPAHLSNQDIVIVEEEPKGSRKFVYHWDQVFIE